MIYLNLYRTPGFPSMYNDVVPLKTIHGPFKSGFLFLLNLAWKSRFRLPALVFLAYMVFDFRIQFEMNIHPHPHRDDDDDDDDMDDDDDDEDDNYYDDDDDSVFLESDGEGDATQHQSVCRHAYPILPYENFELRPTSSSAAPRSTNTSHSGNENRHETSRESNDDIRLKANAPEFIKEDETRRRWAINPELLTLEAL